MYIFRVESDGIRNLYGIYTEDGLYEQGKL